MYLFLLKIYILSINVWTNYDYLKQGYGDDYKFKNQRNQL